jgi:hypothetical protein
VKNSLSVTHHSLLFLGGAKMNDFLSRMIGRKIDIFCGGASSLRGEVLKVEGGVLQLKDDEGMTCYVAIDKIAVVWEARDPEHRAGFVSGQLNNR